MVAGHLQEKKGLFYIVLSFNNAAGKRTTKWMATGLPVKGNKRRAEQLLRDARANYVPEQAARQGVCRLQPIWRNGWK